MVAKGDSEVRKTVESKEIIIPLVAKLKDFSTDKKIIAKLLNLIKIIEMQSETKLAKETVIQLTKQGFVFPDSPVRGDFEQHLIEVKQPVKAEEPEMKEQKPAKKIQKPTKTAKNAQNVSYKEVFVNLNPANHPKKYKKLVEELAEVMQMVHKLNVFP